jgi:hemolysin-activating ACP:hemolysin acyltransferase
MAPVHGKISAAPVASPPDLKVFRPQNPYVALGLATNHLMTKPAFAKLRFGNWSRILVGQINRKHYYFAVDGNDQIQGFMGWALTSKENAEAWVEGRGALSFADSLDGDCVVFNAWAANTGKVNRFLLGEARKVIAGKDTVYFKRFYKDGSVRRRDCASTTSSHNTSGDRTTTRVPSIGQIDAPVIDPLWNLAPDEQRNETWPSS